MAVSGMDTKDANTLYCPKQELNCGKKIEEIIKRESNAVQNLKELGWKTNIIWECELPKNS